MAMSGGADGKWVSRGSAMSMSKMLVERGGAAVGRDGGQMSALERVHQCVWVEWFVCGC
jgi:hypothetical protein